MSLNDAMALVAESQYGLLTLQQVQRCGGSKRIVERRLATRHWSALYDGVYRVGGAPRSWQQELLAAVLAAGPGAVASHRAAAHLWGLNGFTDPPVELSVGRGRLPLRAGPVRHTSTDLDRSVSTTRGGIPVTSPARTVVDLGAVVKPWIVERAISSAVGLRLVTLGGLRAELDALGRHGRRGAGVLRELLDQRKVTSGEPESALEDRMLSLLRRHDLPPPICQYEVRVGARLLGRVDFAYPEILVAIEVDGYEHHSSLDAFQRDRVRQNDLVEAGWLVLRFTWDDVRDRPARVAGQIHRVLVTRGHRFGG